MPSNDRKLSMEELGRVGLQQYQGMVKVPVRVVLDNVRSRHNVGSIFRTADAFALEGLQLCGFTPCPPHREIEKTALGATLSVPWEHHPSTLEALQELKQAGYQVWCVEQTVHAVPLHEWTWMRERPQGRAAPLAIVLGNELSGVSDAVVQASHGCVVIPQTGTKHSLNVSVCAGIVLHHVAGTAAPGLDRCVEGPRLIV